MSSAYTAPGYKLVWVVPAGQGDCHLVGDRRVHPQLTVIQESMGGCREETDPGAIQGTDTDWEDDSLRGQEGRGAAGDSASHGRATGDSASHGLGCKTSNFVFWVYTWVGWFQYIGIKTSN